MTMDTNEGREPMLSAETLYTIGLKASEMKYGQLEQCMAIVQAISGAYENLITTNKLRVVEEVELA
jgi:hypothetical protein